MEVHAHSHTPRKKWTHYFWELTGELQRYYDVMAERVTSNGAVARGYLNDFLLPWYVKHVRAQDVNPLKDSVVTTSPVILDRTPKTDQELLNITDLYRFINLGISEGINRPAASQVDILIQMIKKEYGLQ